MKVWEETWTPCIWMHDHNQDPLWALETNHDPPKAGEVEVPFCDFVANMGPRAKLAAAAPEMARLLLEREWSRSRFEESYCPTCMKEEGSGHAKDCSFLAVLVKAGVVEGSDT